MAQNQSFIWVSFRKEGVHCYPDAASNPALATYSWDDVSFLGLPHRHIFHFKVWIQVFEDDREIEFIQFKRWLEQQYVEGVAKLNNKSCEMLARDLYVIINERYPNREIWVDVSEDGENGALLKFPIG